MKKFLLHLIIPSPSSLARLAADGIREAVNRSDKQEVISKYSKIGVQAAEIAQWATKTLEDGKIDEMERDDIAARLLPLFEKLEEII